MAILTAALLGTLAATAAPMIIDSVISNTASKNKRAEIREYATRQENINKKADVIINELNQRNLLEQRALDAVQRLPLVASYSPHTQEKIKQEEEARKTNLAKISKDLDTVISQRDRDIEELENLKEGAFNKSDYEAI